MKPQELRIGNLVTDNFGISVYTVDSINNKGINLFVEDDGNWSELAKTWVGAEYIFDDIKPISLSEEWAIKFGFIKKIGLISGKSFYEDKHLIIDFNNDSFIYYKKVILNVSPPNSVHQLQNLYYALTGEELEVKA